MEGEPKGGRFEHLTLKHHILFALNGRVMASAVTDGDRDGSQMLTRLTEKAPPGSVYRLDTAVKRTAQRPWV